MFILFDHSTPAPLRYALKGHVIVEAIERGWERRVNGDLLNAAEAAGFELLLTAGGIDFGSGTDVFVITSAGILVI